ncbi:MAG: aminoglycoside phosphotransferase family protein [Sedimentisphaerales bacterium]|nr:aminoglycoside phosphotransferase family protein [Sedimentisphaerales bacterium]
MMAHDLMHIAKQFRLSGEPVEITPLATGHINDTFIVSAERDGQTVRYVLQRINHAVFNDPVGTMDNILRVTEHIRGKTVRADPELATRQLTVFSTHGGPGYHRDVAGNVWRAYNFVEEAVTHDTLGSTEPAYEAARMFGWFQKMLIDLPGPPLHETIRGFHDTPHRLQVFREVLKADPCNRAKNAKAEIDFLLGHAELCSVLTDLVASGEIPVRIAHNDAKINNVMLDKRTGRGVCVIDLDTVMPGLSLYDFGDLVRTAGCRAAEDERDLSKVVVSISMFCALVRGFVRETGEFLTPAEKQHLVFGAKLITFEQFMRFLTDYLAGDVYYKVHREGHNLDRCRTQMVLVESILDQEKAMNALVEKVFQSAARARPERNDV